MTNSESEELLRIERALRDLRTNVEQELGCILRDLLQLQKRDKRGSREGNDQ